MVSQQRSFHIIECPVGVSSSHSCMIVNGRGLPHESLTMFYEELQKMGSVSSRDAVLESVLSFFSFLEQPDQGVEMEDASNESCSSRPCTLKKNVLPLATYWAGSPSEIKAAIRAYLFARWGCLIRSQDQYEEILLSSTVKETDEIQRFLTALRQFYSFAIEQQHYWYEGNPVAAFRVPLRSRILQAIASLSALLRPHSALHQSRVDEGEKEEFVQSINPSARLQEQRLSAVPVEAWIQLVPAA
jgi:hypothetical protein